MTSATTEEVALMSPQLSPVSFAPRLERLRSHLSHVQECNIEKSLVDDDCSRLLEEADAWMDELHENIEALERRHLLIIGMGVYVRNL